MFVRTPRTRLFAATAVALVALSTLTACEDGQGVRDEGPSSATAETSYSRPGTHTPPPGQVHSMRAASVAQ
ncbi:hypothetical protein ACH4TV_47505 [Streptomyces sp. NPDC020898]|uniref:hypothetical protein n=1 Tax=Streptomyces sp. NPDC020898 TaxID=3365101 RepID=UPI0037967DEE